MGSPDLSSARSSVSEVAAHLRVHGPYLGGNDAAFACVEVCIYGFLQSLFEDRVGCGGRGQARIPAKEIHGSDETPAWNKRAACALEFERARECDGMDITSGTPRRRNRVRELRENRLMTQAQLARKAKVALRTIHSVEKGMNCRMDTKRKILLALSLRFEDKDQVFPPVEASHRPDLVPQY